MSSRPHHPIQPPHRPLRTTPDDSEPPCSFEDTSPAALLLDEEDVHNRLMRGRQSFWRDNEKPSFSSMNLKSSEATRKTSGILLQQQLEERNGNASPSNNNNSSFNSLGETITERSLLLKQRDSTVSLGSNNSRDQHKKKEVSKQRAADRRRKLDVQTDQVEHGHIIELPPESIQTWTEVNPVTSLDRSSSDQSTGSVLYGKTPTANNMLGKSSSLIFPTGVDTSTDGDVEVNNLKRRKINFLLDQCEAVRFPFKKKLALNNLGIGAADIPLNYLCGTYLGNSLQKLSLAGNRLGSIPAKLVQNLPTLKHLDLSQCELHQLPTEWSLPQLKRLHLSHNRLRDFPEETMLEGLPELQELNMYGNKVAEIIIPSNPNLLSKLEILNLGYNDLAYLPDDLDQLKSLKTLKVMNNFLEKVPMRVCDMDLRTIDVSSNPVIQPPIETCERGICSMKRYYHQLRLEEQSRAKALEEVQKKVQKPKLSKKKSYNLFTKSLSMTPKLLGTPRRHRDDTSSSVVNSIRSDDSGGSNESPKAYESLEPSSLPKEALLKTSLYSESSDGSSAVASIGTATALSSTATDQVTVNDTLKVIFVGMAMVGKTSMIKRLIEGRDAVVPTHDERTVGVDIYEWDPKKDTRFEHIDSRIEIQDSELKEICGDVDVKFSVWDFAGQHVYHATHELFFSPRALYVLVWDMGATNRKTLRGKSSLGEEKGAFRLSYDSSDDDNDESSKEDDFAAEEEARRADRELERDIDEKVQFWIDCIQSSAPGSAILPVASFADFFAKEGGQAEAKRRCGVLKQRLQRHEERRIQGIKERLQDYIDQNRADDPSAIRLRKLLCSYTRPKLIFEEDDENSVVRVSGTEYTGFDHLTEKIINIAIGRYKGLSPYPIFHGHVGARIPRMRLKVREVVRTMRDKFKVVEWGYFINQLRDYGLKSVEDISDALHFLTNIGELSYFGGVMTDENSNSLDVKATKNIMSIREKYTESDDDNGPITEDDEDDDLDDDTAILSMDEISIKMPNTDDGSFTTVESMMSNNGLSQFVFLNPRWLVAAVACILRHDLDREIRETRRIFRSGKDRSLSNTPTFYDTQLNCPVITADDACLLWQAKHITKKAAERAQQYSNDSTVTPFEFLQLLLIRFGVFVPIDLSIEKALLGGKEYTHLVEDMLCDAASCKDENNGNADIVLGEENPFKANFFFLPSLLGPGEPAEAWTYKNMDSWKTTLCHSVLFPDGVPPGLMERLTACVLSAIYAVAHRNEKPILKEALGNDVATYEGKLRVREILCWRTAFYIKLGTQVPTSDGSVKESIVEIFSHLADRDSHLCVGSDYMGVGMRRLIISGRGQVGDGGRKIWKGGYLLILKCVRRVMDAYGGLEFEKHGFCPECLSKKAVSEASSWDLSVIRAAVLNGESELRCQHGHRVDARLLSGPIDAIYKPKNERRHSHIESNVNRDPIVPVQELLRSVVVVGLWDDKAKKVVRVGSGFIVDRKQGLIVTASHTVMNIREDKNFGEDYWGLRHGKIVIGVIPREGESDETKGKDVAVFRYFAKIAAKDPSIEKGECHIDACVLRITTRLEHDVASNGEGCGDQPEILLLNNPVALKSERLKSLKITEKCELEEQVRIIGYNQGGEGLLGPGESLNRFVDFARGYVCKKFASAEETTTTVTGKLRDRFKPHKEIVVICPTIGGHSGGPCVNQQGEVIGILSRADPAESQRCYISPTYEWKELVRIAKRNLNNVYIN